MTPREQTSSGRRDRATGIAEELHQAKPFHSLAQEAFLSLLRTADVARRRFAKLLADAGVTFQQYNVLRILRGAEPHGLPTLDIAGRMIERTPGVTRIIDRLEAKGWVRRARDSGDRRRVYCRITRAGLDLLASLDDPVARTDDAIFEGLTEPDVRRLVDLLDQLRGRLADHVGDDD